MSSTTSLTTYKFYNKEWFIAADVVRHYKLSSNYNTYYSKYYSNGRLYGPVTSFEFRLSGVYLEEFKRLHSANNASLSKSSAVWLIDEETTRKLLNKDIISNKEKTVKTVESNELSIRYNLGIDKTFEELKIKHLVDNKSNTQVIEPNNDMFIPTPVNLLDDCSAAINNTKEDKTAKIASITYSKYSEEEISDAITLLSSKLTNTPYQQEKLLESGSIRLDLFSCTRRSVYALELKKGVITLDMIKEKLEVKHYLTSIMNAYPDLNITFIFSSPMGITWDGFLYLQEASRSIGPHKIIYRPCSNLILDMINKKEKELPSYYYRQILDKPIIKYLLQVS
jgi:hypothetical protein